jgi:prolyl-tRNA synthetase
VPAAALGERVPALLDEVQRSLYARALAFRRERTLRLDDYAELVAAFQSEEGVFVEAHWCGDAACEARVKEETKATIRNIPFDAPAEQGRCIVDGKPGIGKRVVFAKAY